MLLLLFMNMERDAGKLRSDLHERNLQMLGGFVGMELRNRQKRDEEIARAVEIGRLFQSAGGGYLIAADSGDDRRRGEAGHVDPSGALTDEQWKSLATGLNDLARELAPIGVRVIFHNHVGTYVETEEETARLLDETDPALVSWCLDCGHLAYGGGDTLGTLQKYGNRVGYVHIKDVGGHVLQKSPRERLEFCPGIEIVHLRPRWERASPEYLRSSIRCAKRATPVGW
jgi:inosose dehydratase